MPITPVQGVRRAKMRPEKLKSAQRMRREPTPAERRMWNYLRGRRLLGVKFRRQALMWGYIADFYAPSIMLCIEVDGKYHETRRDADTMRNNILFEHGIRTLRFTNERVLWDGDAVLAEIGAVIESLDPARMKRERRALKQESPEAA